MKSLLIAFLFIATINSKPVAAAEPNAVTPVVLKSFQATFAQASSVDWTRADDLYRVAFVLRNQYITAYYTADGNLQALTRHIATENLPMLLQASLAKAPSQWISDVFEVTSEGSVQYYVTLEDAATKVIYKSSGAAWTLYQKNRKD